MCITSLQPHAPCIHAPSSTSVVHTSHTTIPSPCVCACVCMWGSSIFWGVTNIDDPPFPLFPSLSLAFSHPSAGICVYTYLLHIFVCTRVYYTYLCVHVFTTQSNHPFLPSLSLSFAQVQGLAAARW